MLKQSRHSQWHRVRAFASHAKIGVRSLAATYFHLLFSSVYSFRPILVLCKIVTGNKLARGTTYKETSQKVNNNLGIIENRQHHKFSK